MANDASAPAMPELTIERTFAAPPELVFAAWSSAEHLQRWFCPAQFSIPHARIEFRAGGTFEICMRAPTGEEHWMRGRYVEIHACSRLVIDMDVCPPEGPPLFRAHTEVGFEPQAAGTRMRVTQRYEPLQPVARPMIDGARLGWEQTLERLAGLLAQANG